MAMEGVCVRSLMALRIAVSLAVRGGVLNDSDMCAPPKIAA
jgi:hypothetical protein